MWDQFQRPPATGTTPSSHIIGGRPWENPIAQGPLLRPPSSHTIPTVRDSLLRPLSSHTIPTARDPLLRPLSSRLIGPHPWEIQQSQTTNTAANTTGIGRSLTAHQPGQQESLSQASVHSLPRRSSHPSGEEYGNNGGMFRASKIGQYALKLTHLQELLVSPTPPLLVNGLGEEIHKRMQRPNEVRPLRLSGFRASRGSSA